MVTSPYEWKILERDNKQTNKQTLNPLYTETTVNISDLSFYLSKTSIGDEQAVDRGDECISKRINIQLRSFSTVFSCVR